MGYRIENQVRILLTFVIAVTVLFSPLNIIAETLESDDYRIEGATLNAGGEVVNSTNYSLHNTVGDFTGDPRLDSANYSLKTGIPNVFIANVPIVECFETVSDGSSNCLTGPSYIVANGMVTVCGHQGCFDKARVEIDTQNNPDDTLYGIQLSEDEFVSDIQIIDWTTRSPVSFSSREVSDYKTKEEWEDYDNSYSTGWTSGYNIQGLKPGVEYSVRIVALHGDFTESSPSPIAQSTTAQPSLSLDLDIANTSGSGSETAYPYGIQMSLIGDVVTTASDLIWLDINSNAPSGVTLAQRGLNGGLESTSYTIDSATADLDIVAEGFGLQSYTTAQSYTGVNGELATLSIETDYAGTSNYVGEINTSLLDTYTTNGPVKNGRVSMYVKAKPAFSTPAGNYFETITMILIAQY